MAQARGGFTLVEVLFACALLALAIVPLVRATGNNRRVADALRSLVRQSVEDGDAAARESRASLKADLECKDSSGL